MLRVPVLEQNGWNLEEGRQNLGLTAGAAINQIIMVDITIIN